MFESRKVGASDTNDRDKDKQQAKEENKDLQQTMTFLAKVNLFERLPKDNHLLLAQAFQNVEFNETMQLSNRVILAKNFSPMS